MFVSAMEVGQMTAWNEPLPPLAEAQAIAAEYRDKKLPLRAWPIPILRALWSSGQTAMTLERRESPAIEKPIEAMSIEDLIATQNSEPLSESRRSFLTTGNGVLSLEQTLSGPENDPISLAEAVSGEFDVPINPDEDLIGYDERAARRSRFTPFDQIDLVTQRQIDWEQYQAQCGNTHVTRVVRTPTGGIGLKRISRWTPAATLRQIAASKIADIKRIYGADATTDWDTLQSRVDLLNEGLRVNNETHNEFEARAYERWAIAQINRPPFAADRLDHSAFERVEPALLIPRRHRYYLMRDLNLRQATRLAKAGAEPVKVVLDTVRRPSRRRYSDDWLWTWHHTARDDNELDVTRIDGALPRLIRAEQAPLHHSPKPDYSGLPDA